jgi:hypothetical protein
VECPFFTLFKTGYGRTSQPVVGSGWQFGSHFESLCWTFQARIQLHRCPARILHRVNCIPSVARDKNIRGLAAISADSGGSSSRASRPGRAGGNLGSTSSRFNTGSVRAEATESGVSHVVEERGAAPLDAPFYRRDDQPGFLRLFAIFEHRGENLDTDKLDERVAAL